MVPDKLILLVEDSDDDVQLTLRALRLQRVAHRVQVARDGSEALDFMFCRGAFSDRDPAQQPHLVLLDLKLPRISGLEVLEKLREDPRTKRLPVVVLTSSNQQNDLTRSYDLGANSYVRKPVDFSEFTEAIKNLGLYWLVLNEAAPNDA